MSDTANVLSAIANLEAVKLDVAAAATAYNDAENVVNVAIPTEQVTFDAAKTIYDTARDAARTTAGWFDAKAAYEQSLIDLESAIATRNNVIAAYDPFST
jgi:hypothetical protein